MQPIDLPAGSEVYIGAPAVPMESGMVAALAGLVSSDRGVLEAHLPQLYAPAAMSAPAQVLVIVTNDADRERTLEKIEAGLGRILRDGQVIDVWPISPSDQLLSSVRKADCRLSQGTRRAGIIGRLRRFR